MARGLFAAFAPPLRVVRLVSFFRLIRALSFFCAFLRRIFIEVRLSCFPMEASLFGKTAVLSRSLQLAAMETSYFFTTVVHRLAVAPSGSHAVRANFVDGMGLADATVSASRSPTYPLD